MIGGLLTRTDEEILRAMHRYRYMTAKDVCFHLFTPGALTYVRTTLAALSGEDFAKGRYLYRFLLPDTKRGNPQRVYTLGRTGRKYGEQVLGLPVNWSFNPERDQYAGFFHLQHSLMLTKVLIAAAKWSDDLNLYKLVETRTSYELSRLREFKEAAIAIPDAWLLFKRGDKRYPILLEVDLGTENIKKFKQHIAARIAFIESGKYEEIFKVDACLIAYLVIGSEERCTTLGSWTREILKDMGILEWASIFRFAFIKPNDIYSLSIFNNPFWRKVGAGYTKLLD